MASFSDYPYEKWMEHLPESLHGLPMNYLAIPGSHDSFSYVIDSSSKVAPDSPDAFKTLEKVFGILARKVISLWSRSQSKTFTQQLMAGIRYLDLRTAPKIEDKERPLFFVHGMYAMEVREALVEIKEFLSSHPKEVVLLDFNHFYSMDPVDFGRLRTLVTTTFKDMLIPVSSSTRAPSLSEVWEKHQQVIVFFHNSFHAEDFWPGYLCPSLWPNTEDPRVMVAYNESNYRSGRQGGNSFLVCQGVLTPGTKLIVLHAFEGLKYLARKANPAFVPWVSTKQAGDPMGINICILDFVEDADYIGTVLMLNVKQAR